MRRVLLAALLALVGAGLLVGCAPRHTPKPATPRVDVVLPSECQNLTPDDWFWWWFYGCGKDAAGGGGSGAA